MLRQSQVVAAFGRRLFDEGELNESSSDNENISDSKVRLSALQI